jgi:hypothetical protein
MKTILLHIIKTACLVAIGLQAHTQDDWEVDQRNMVSYDSATRHGYTLIYYNKDTAFNESLKQRMIEAFFTVYPAEATLYNKATADKVIFFMDPAYDGVAATSGNIVRFNPAWFHRNPGDIDVVTHEVMHIVQSYPDDAAPGWLTEGIADYVRYSLGIDNPGANWSLTAFSASQNYDNAYRITARFLAWLEKNKLKGIVQQLDRAMRSKHYKKAIWKRLTGKNVDDLWKEYAKNPTL